MRVIAFVNQKGGCAKTTTVQNVGAALALRGKKVLLVDIDPQANLTEGCGFISDDIEKTTYDLMLSDIPVQSALHVVKNNLWLLPTNIDLAEAEMRLSSMPYAGAFQLKRKLDTVKDDFDYILIDSPPSLGHLTFNGLTAASEILVPLQTEIYSFRAIDRLMKTIKAIKETSNPHLIVSGVVCTIYRKERVLNKAIEVDLRERFGDKVLKTMIRDNVKLAEAPGAGKDIFAYMSNCQGAWDYKALGDEIIAMEGR